MNELKYFITMIKNNKKDFELVVNGNSMYPTIKNGAKLLIYYYNNQKLKIGDIIVYKKSFDHLTVHRIVNIVKLNDLRFYCETKGDNNEYKDKYFVLNCEILGILGNKI